MSDKRIDQLTDSITSSADLDGSELFVVSDPDASHPSGFKSKKITLDTIRNYIGTHCGPVFYDMSDVASDEYRWKIGKIGNHAEDPRWVAGDVMFDHTFTRDVLFCAYYSVGLISSVGTPVKCSLDGVEINLNSFASYRHSMSKLYIKRGQNVKCVCVESGRPFAVSTFPIIGGGVFIDTSKPNEFVLLQSLYEFESISFPVDSIVNCDFTNEAQGAYWDGKAYDYADYLAQTLDGKKFIVNTRTDQGAVSQMYVKAGQTIMPQATDDLHQQHHVSAYPILY